MVTFDIITRLAVSLVFGFLLGFERQYYDQIAGVRTTSLVCLGACAFVLFSEFVAGDDSSRVAAQVVSGIGFLGAGVIVHDGLTVRGLTTAATLWCVSAIGVLIGGGYILAGSIIAGLVLLVNLLIRPISEKLRSLQGQTTFATEFYNINLRCKSQAQFGVRAHLISTIGTTKFKIVSMEAIPQDDEVKIAVRLSSIVRNDLNLNKIVNELAMFDSVIYLDWTSEEVANKKSKRAIRSIKCKKRR